MTIKHTPGPWVIADEGTTGWDICTVYATEVGYVEIKATKVGDEEDYKAENYSNARLIAAAPDLLEALQRMLVINSLGAYAQSEAISAARAAIAKATKGES